MIFWWFGWVLICVPAGTLAGVGLIEFNWGGPPYDGGFMGDLVLFGGFLAFGQAPFVAWYFARGVGGGSSRRYAAAVAVAIAWPLAGFFGWTFGSFVEVSLSDIFPLYSHSNVAARSVRWLVVGVAEGFILAAVLPAPGSRRDAGRARVALLGLCAAWAGVSVFGGLLVESWAALEFAARSDEVNQIVGGFLEGSGVAENVARVVVPYALFVPLLYGIPSGWVFWAIRETVARDQR